MKYIAVILSFLTIALSSIPCDDDITMSEQLVVTSQNSDTHAGDITDLCTPFCTCVCCATIVLEPNIQQDISNLVISTSELNTSYTVSFSCNFLNRIFQPPQV